jgi:LmbE family N-acetylglucosaminyl deacetylase
LLVSPHPDDAAISLGASLLKHARVATTVWNVFSLQHYSLVERDGEAAQRRLEREETEAAALLGTRVVMAGLPEAELRGYRALSQRIGRRREEVLSQRLERELLGRVAVEFGRLRRAVRPAFVALPLAVGGHVDHLLAREAALAELADAGRVRGLFFYEDLPYALNAAWTGAAVAELNARGYRLAERTVDVAACLERKRRVLEVYRSQLRPGDVRRIVDHGRVPGGRAVERIWLPRVLGRPAPELTAPDGEAG